MTILLITSFFISCALYIVFKRYYPRFMLLYMPAAITMTSLVIYPFAGQGNFINRALILTMTSMLLIGIILAINYQFSFTVRKTAELFMLTLLISLLIPLLLTSSSDTKYWSAAYLSISVFIAGYIIFALGIIDSSVKTSKYSIYRFIKHPVTYGIVLIYSTIVLLTLFMPYNYLYIIWFIYLLFYIFKREQIK
ncbi:hypothetical protein [Macrococcus lamae]|uniref:Uncharacterized protein n=1 Tax=Macrococcus lamae TaxID=198484 RepID=A0A4R6BV16_9STAP|nr:hypothetical protein [Macrococcus lamae]TDM12206.1 hypothetical protein ERX29_03835 [Macrococcus lamae]